MSKIQRPVLYMNTYTCTNCGTSKLSPTLPEGWKEYYYLDTTLDPVKTYGNTWHLGYECADCLEKQRKDEFHGSTN